MHFLAVVNAVSLYETTARLFRPRQWLAMPLWFPTGKNSVPIDSGIPFECFSTRRPASRPAFGGLLHKLTNTL